MPRIQSIARPMPQDRNWGPVQWNYAGVGVAPHGTTTRATATAAAGTRLICQRAVAQVLRITAAAPIGRYFATVDASGYQFCLAKSLDNTVGGRVQNNSDAPVELNAGNSFRIQTSDASTGGTVDYDVVAILAAYNV